MDVIRPIDKRLSAAVVVTWTRYLSNSRWPHLLLEWSIHGWPWAICTACAFIYVCRKQYTPEVQRQFGLVLLGVLLDLAATGVLKLTFRRPRPPYNKDDQLYEAPVADKFSFPSGHTSRATTLAVLAVYLIPLRRRSSQILMYTFPVFVGISRVAMGRHYIGDVIGGFVLGSIDALLLLELPNSIFHYAAKLINTFNY